MSKLKILLVLMIVFLLGVFGAKLIFERYLQSSLALENKAYELNIETGASLIKIINRLAADDVVQSPDFLIAYARITDKINIKSGFYELVPPLSHYQLLEKLVAGDVKQYRITLIEGWTISQVMDRLNNTENLVKILEGEIPSSIEFEGGSAEGWLFPDTYSFDKTVSDDQLVKQAYERMQTVLAEEWAVRAADLPYKNSYEALIMASIIERETSVDSEREQIAGVFVLRLQKRMRLQTDPTVIYAMGDSYNGNIRRSDLKIDSPYNTYRINGLPPTPIAIAGRRSIQAALQPLNNGMLYFVGKGDGYHYFSKSLDEHNIAVQKYQRSQRKSNYRSTPVNQEESN
ncbi:MAG: UPF0755 protein [Pseudomonadales bacterium]|jgi:UPF0755 protein